MPRTPSISLYQLMSGQILDKLPSDVNARTVTLSNKPHGGEDRLITALKGVTVGHVGLS